MTLWLGAVWLCAARAAPLAVPDDHGNMVTLPAPARRAVTLAPHAAELAYAAGAGAYVVGTVSGTDYPPAARAIASVGNGALPDAERIAAMHPDLVIGWQSAAAGPLAPMLNNLGVALYYSDPQTLDAIPQAVERMGLLFGTHAHARAAAGALRARLAALRARYAGRPPVRVFIQAGLEPLYTLNRQSIVSDAVALCGGVNVFGDAPVVAPQVSLEAVLAARPQAVLAGVARPADAAANLRAWQETGLPAATAKHVFGIDADMLYRPAPRLVDAAEEICRLLDSLRG